MWDDWNNVEAYREHVESYPLYPALNRRLARLADLGEARRVLDLACGTGATTAACLELLPAGAEILAIDSAASMVEVARCRVRDPRARFLCRDVAELDHLQLERFDRVVCNAASWLFPRPGAVLSALKRHLVTGGLVVFNVPAERIAGSPVEPHPFQVELAASLGPRRLPAERLFDRQRIAAVLSRHGFELENVELYRHVGRQEELMELMQIPAMARRLAPYLAREDGLRIVRAAAERCDPDLEVDVPWLYFVARHEEE